MHSVGERLKRARIDQGLDLGTVAALTKINAKYLQAIEADQRDGLPSNFFYKSFVHQYAKVLGLETAPLDAEVDRLISADAPLPLPGQESTVSKDFRPVRLSRRRMPALAPFTALALVLVGCSGIYLWWHTVRTSGSSTANRTIAAVNPPPAPVAVPVSESEKVVAIPAQAAVPAAPQPLPGIESIPGAKVLLDLIAREETWLSVSSGRKWVFSGVLAPNQSKVVEGKEFAKLKVGNAAGLEVKLNGKFLGALGGRGQVLTIIFTRDSFQIVMPGAKEGDD